MPNTKGIPIVLFDDSDSAGPDSKYTEAGIGVKKVLRTDNSGDLLAAAKEVLGD